VTLNFTETLVVKSRLLVAYRANLLLAHLMGQCCFARWRLSSVVSYSRL